jgi:hypothetical protein
MRIKWTNHPYNPELNGTVEHVPVSVYESAITFKQGVGVARPNYGTPEWAAERALADKNRVPSKDDAVILMGTAWGLYQQLGKVAIIKTVNGESFFYEQPPAECPENVRNAFQNATAGDPVAAAEALDAAKRSQLETEQKEKTSMFGVLFKRT